MIDMISTVEDAKAALADPEAFVQTMLAAAGPAAKKLLIAKLRPKLEPHVLRDGLAWEDVAPALELVDSVSELEAAMDDPEAFLARLLTVAGPAAKRMAIARLRPSLEPLLQKADKADLGLDWKSLVPVLELVESAEELEAGLVDPEAFLARLLSSDETRGAAAAADAYMDAS